MNIVNFFGPANNLDMIKNTLTSDDILVINDHFIFDDLKLLFKIKGRPRCVVTNAYLTGPELINDVPAYYMVGLPAHLLKSLTQQATRYNVGNDYSFDTKFIFNFMMNKKRVTRFLTLKIIEYFKLTNFTYSYVNDATYDINFVMNELFDQDFNRELLNSDFFSFIGHQPTTPFKQYGDMNWHNYESNVIAWEVGLNNVFLESAVAIITETVIDQATDYIMLTEKTFYAFMGRNFPIWPGLKNHIAELNALGVDTFDDIIDHSYQNYNSLLERCFYAIYDNLEILTNFQLASELRSKHIDRLNKNAELIPNNVFINHFFKKVKTLPEDVSECLEEYATNQINTTK